MRMVGKSLGYFLKISYLLKDDLYGGELFENPCIPIFIRLCEVSRSRYIYSSESRGMHEPWTRMFVNMNLLWSSLGELSRGMSVKGCLTVEFPS